MKTEHSLIRILLGIIVFILVIIALIGIVDKKVVMPYMLTCLGVFQIFNGLHYYKLDKKTDGILAILSSVFILGVVFSIIIL